MEEKFLTFRRYSNQEDADQMIKTLEENGINYLIEDASPTFDITFSGSNLNNEIHIKIPASKFDSTEEIILKLNDVSINNIPDGYYLLEFSDEELFEILIKPDEWNPTDFNLSKEILKSRGKAVDDELIKALKKQRLDDLSKPEESQRSWVFAGYLFALLGGFIGIIIGWHLWRFKKTLPNGDRAYGYIENDRKHGKTIMVIGTVFLVLGTLAKIYNLL